MARRGGSPVRSPVVRAWRNRGFADGAAGRETSAAAAERAGAEASAAYRDGVRCGRRERQAAQPG